MDCLEGQRTKFKKVKIGVRKYKRCLIITKEKLQRLFVLFVLYLMTGALYRTVPPTNPYMKLTEKIFFIKSSISCILRE